MLVVARADVPEYVRVPAVHPSVPATNSSANGNGSSNDTGNGSGNGHGHAEEEDTAAARLRALARWYVDFYRPVANAAEILEVVLRL